jgi:hypothetical protein
MYDETENARRERIGELNTDLTENKDARRAELEKWYGLVWDTEQLREDFEVIGFLAPYVAVREKATGKKGSVEFTHSPRFYFNFQYD